jgi:hypothetical protein
MWSEPDPEGRRLLHELNIGTGVEDDDNSDVAAISDDDAEPQESDKFAHPVYERRSAYAQRRAKNKKDEKAFKVVDVPNLAAHLGEPVILYTYFGRKVEGRLIDVDDKVITVEHRLVDGRGTATYPISRDKVQSARLYY